MAERHPATSNRILYEVGYDPGRLAHYEGLFTQGSGILHLRGSLCEPLESAPQDDEYWRLPTNVTAEARPPRSAIWGTYLPSVVGHHPLLNTVVVNLPWPLATAVAADGRLLTVESDSLRDHRRRFDLRAAVLSRETRFDLSNHGTNLVTLRETRFVSRVRPNLVVQQFEVESRDEAEIAVLTGIDGAVRTNGFDHFRHFERPTGSDGRLTVAVETDGGYRVLVSTLVAFPADAGRAGEAKAGLSPAGSPAPDSPRHSRPHETGAAPFPGWEQDERRVAQRFSLSAAPNRPARFTKYSMVVNCADVADTGRADVATQLRDARAVGFESLRAEHEAAWRALWADADVRMQAQTAEPPPGGDSGAGGTSPAAALFTDRLSRALDLSIHHLLRAHRRGVTEFAICPKAHAGEAYFGRYFWDTEIYLLPFFLFTDPDHARDLLRFRIRTLDGARRNAAAYRGRGARFAWESSLGGEEECPNWQYADHEIHVTADIVYGVMHYVAATGDEEFLFTEAAPLVIEAARYLESRVDRTDGAHLIGVMGPDEYSPFSVDNAYTNRMVRFALETAAGLVDRLRSERPSRHSELVAQLGIEVDEHARFRATAAELPIPMDETQGIILQSADFAHYPPLDFAGIPRPVAAHVPQELLYRRKALKQADVLTMLALFPDDYAPDLGARCFDYYEPLTTHDSSLSPTTHALVAAQLGRADEAAEFLSRSMEIDVGDECGDASQGIHAANAAGTWLVVVRGFLGVRPAAEAGVLRIAPSLPSALGGVETEIRWRGARLRVAAMRRRDGSTESRVSHREGPSVDVELAGRRLTVGAGAALSRRVDGA